MAQAAKVMTAMGNASRLIACVADDVTREAVSRAAAQLGWTDAAVRDGGVATAPHTIDPNRPPAVLLVDLAGEESPVSAVADLIALCGQQTRIITLGAINDVGLFRELMALGVADYLVKPASSELLAEALGRSVRRDETKAEAPRSTRLFAFIGARGGVGTTTVAIATAWLLAHEFDMRTALLDLDLHFGNLALGLDLEPGRGLREAFENPERTDNLLLASAMAQGGDKIPVLAAEEPLEEMLSFDPEALGPLLGALSQDYECIVADVPRTLDGVGRKVLAVADQAVVVSDLSLSALRDSLRLLELASSLGCRTKPLLLANQVGAGHRGEVGRSEFERGLGGAIDLAVPFDVKAAMAMARSAKALPAAAGSSKPVIELRRLATRLAGREVKQRGGLRRLFG